MPLPSKVFTLCCKPHFSSLPARLVPVRRLPASWWSWLGKKKWGEDYEGPPSIGFRLFPFLSSKPSTWQLNGRLSKIHRRLGRNPAWRGVSWQKQKNGQITICETYPFLSQPEALFSQQTPYPFGKEQSLPVSVDMSLAAQPKRA